nr:WAT1-related protein At5g40240-like [Ipomoea batatas]
MVFAFQGDTRLTSPSDGFCIFFNSNNRRFVDRAASTIAGVDVADCGPPPQIVRRISPEVHRRRLRRVEPGRTQIKPIPSLIFLPADRNRLSPVGSVEDVAQPAIGTLSKAAMNAGLTTLVYIVYYNFLDTLLLLPTFIIRRRRSDAPSLTFSILCKCFILCMLGIIDLFSSNAFESNNLNPNPKSNQFDSFSPDGINHSFDLSMISLIPFEEYRNSRNAFDLQSLPEQLAYFCSCSNIPRIFIRFYHPQSQALFLRAGSCCNRCSWCVDYLSIHILVRKLHPQDIRFEELCNSFWSNSWRNNHFCFIVKRDKKC